MFVSLHVLNAVGGINAVLTPFIFLGQKAKKPPLGGFFLLGPGSLEGQPVLLSHGETPHYPCAGHRSALIRFTSEFGMESGGAVSLWLPGRAG